MTVELMLTEGFSRQPQPAQERSEPSLGGWELESAHWVAARAARQLQRLQESRADRQLIEMAVRRYGSALNQVRRIRASLQDDSTAE